VLVTLGSGKSSKVNLAIIACGLCLPSPWVGFGGAINSRHMRVGDYLEDIHRRCAAGQRWRVYLRVVAAIFWTGLNAVGYAMKLVGRRRAR